MFQLVCQVFTNPAPAEDQNLCLRDGTGQMGEHQSQSGFCGDGSVGGCVEWVFQKIQTGDTTVQKVQIAADNSRTMKVILHGTQRRGTGVEQKISAFRIRDGSETVLL